MRNRKEVAPPTSDRRWVRRVAEIRARPVAMLVGASSVAWGLRGATGNLPAVAKLARVAVFVRLGRASTARDLTDTAPPAFEVRACHRSAAPASLATTALPAGHRRRVARPRPGESACQVGASLPTRRLAVATDTRAAVDYQELGRWVFAAARPGRNPCRESAWLRYRAPDRVEAACPAVVGNRAEMARSAAGRLPVVGARPGR